MSPRHTPRAPNGRSRGFAPVTLVCAALVGLGLGASIMVTAAMLAAIRQAPERHSDFLTYYTAARLLESNLSPYDPAAQQQLRSQLPGTVVPEPNVVLLYFLPAPLLVAILPFTRLSPWAANVLWTCLQAFVVWPACLLILRRQLSGWGWLLTATWAFLWAPMMLCLKFGQLSLVLLLAFLGLQRSLLRSGEILGGICLAVLTIKPPLVLVPLLLITKLRRWKLLLAGLTTSVIGYGITIMAFPRPELLPEYIRSLSLAAEIQGADRTWRLSSFSLAAITGPFNIVQWPFLLVLQLAIVGLWMAILQRRGTFEAVLSMPTISVLISPHVFIHDLVLCLTLLPLLTRRSNQFSIAFTATGFVLPWFAHLIVLRPSSLGRTLDPLPMVTWEICVVTALLLVPPVFPAGSPPHELSATRARGPMAGP
jgi:hypothetical protein